MLNVSLLAFWDITVFTATGILVPLSAGTVASILISCLLPTLVIPGAKFRFKDFIYRNKTTLFYGLEDSV